MKIQNLEKVLVLISIILCSAFLFSQNIYYSRNSTKQNISIQISNENLTNNPINSITVSPFTIDDSRSPFTWNEMNLLYDWITGEGTEKKPYVIENLIINAGGSGSGIIVNNSNVYFIIRNCTIFNSRDLSSNHDAGIKLVNVNNSRIINNNCSNNDMGIYMESCNDNNIINNTLNNNLQIGLASYYCSFNNMINNTLYNNSQQGLFMFVGYKNKISDNLVFNNSLTGIELFFSFNISIIRNAIYNNSEGIRLNASGSNSIYFNTIDSNVVRGIISDGSWNIPAPNPLHFYNYISWNIIKKNGIGILLSDTNRTIVKGNIIDNCSLCGIALAKRLAGSGDNIVFANYFTKKGIYAHALDFCVNNKWDNGFIGNYWEGFVGTDSNGDGIGETPFTFFPPAYASQDNHPIFENPFFNGSKIHIDDTDTSARNWSTTSLMKAWCKGEGTEEIPYILEDLRINGINSGSCILIENSKVHFQIENCILFNSSSANNNAGIKLVNAANGTLINNNCSYNHGHGIYLELSDNNTISGNLIHNNTIYGIFLNNSNNNRLIENIISNHSNCGIKLDNVRNGHLIKNNCSNNYVGIDLIESSKLFVSDNTLVNNSLQGLYISNCNNSRILRNNIYNNSEGFRLWGQNNNLSIYENDIVKSDSRGMFCYCRYSKIYDNKFTQNDVAMELISSRNNTIFNNTFFKNNYGLYSVYGSTTDCNNISSNAFLNNSIGIYLTELTDTTISNNFIANNSNSGIILYAVPPIAYIGYDLIIKNQILNNNGPGIELLGYNGVGGTKEVLYINITENLIMNNDYGIILKNADYNLIKQNLIEENDYIGLNVSGEGVRADNNLIYYNAFIGNDLINAQDFGTNNNWDNGLIGNYWDDYVGADGNGDGIGDTAYLIAGTGLDDDNKPIFNIPYHQGEKIHIDGNGISAWNWSQTALIKWWCYGEGTYENPYVIEDLKINCINSGSCILIENSKVCFKIENCTLFNSSSANNNAGIKLVNVVNCTLINNNCSYNKGHGIYLEFSDNNTISGNLVHNNTINGIFLNNSNNNRIIGNTVSNHSNCGILLDPSNYNWITYNIIKYNYYGIYIAYSIDNIISGNIFVGNTINMVEVESGGSGEGGTTGDGGDDDDDGGGKEEFNIIEFLTSPIGLALIGGSIAAVAIITIVKIKGAKKTRLKEIELIKKIKSE